MDKKNIENIYPLSPQQQGMLLESLYASDAGIQGAHIEQFACVLRGNLDVRAFEKAWQQTIDKHSSLRTTFVWREQDEPLQVVLRHVNLPFECQDWRRLSPVEQQARLRAFLTSERQRGFDLSKAPLIRVAVFQIDDNAHQLVWTFHHILMDGWSHNIVLNDIFSAYLVLSRGQSLSQNPSPPYRNYVAWLKKQDLHDAKLYWQDRLRHFTQPIPLGIESALNSSSAQEEPFGYQFAHLPATITKNLQALAQQQHVTLNTLVQGVWALLLSRYSGQSDIVFGTTISGRPSDLPNVESIVGLFINSLPLRIQVSPQTGFWAWLQELQAQQLDLQHHSYCSAGQIHQWSEMPGTLPLYESLLVFENYPADFSTFESVGLAFELGDRQMIGAQTNHALTFLVTVGLEIELQVVYQCYRLDGDSVSRILKHFVDFLENVTVSSERSLAMLFNRIPADQIPQVRPLQRTGPPGTTPALVLPRTPTEETLARIWTDLVGVEQVGIHDSFFQMGGYSLLAIEVISRIRDAFQIELPLRSLFEAPTIADLAVVIAQKQAEQVDDEVLGQLLTELEQAPPEAIKTM